MNHGFSRTHLMCLSLVFAFVTMGFPGFFIMEEAMDLGSVTGEVIIVDMDGHGNYTSIQAAINNANPGDTVQVWSGIYRENLIIDKTITLVGNGSLTTTIDGTNSGNVISITENWVNITGFRLINSSLISQVGIGLYAVNNVHIYDINCTTNYDGILTSSSDHNLIENNSFFNNSGYGIHIFTNSQYNHIKNNTCDSNQLGGIRVWVSSSNKLINNKCFNSPEGILLDSSVSTLMRNNTMFSSSMLISGPLLSHWNTHDIDSSNIVNNKVLTYWKNATDDIISDDGAQIILAKCSRITIQNKYLSNVCIGITIGFSDNITLSNSVCDSNSKYGIYIYQSNNNELFNVSCTQNEISGILFEESNENVVDDCTFNTNEENGIYLRTSSKNYITNSTVSSNSLFGIHSQLSNWNTIENNNLDSNLDKNIYLVYSFYNDIIQNNCTFSQSGISLENSNSNRIENNTCDADGNLDGFYGIHLISGWNNEIVNNLCLNNQYGIGILKSGIVPPTSNEVVNNTCMNQYAGIMVQGNSHTIKDNKCDWDTQSIGIILDYAEDCEVINNSCNSNTIYGIFLKNSISNIVEKNQCNSNGRCGIQINSHSGYHSNFNYLTGNTCNFNDKNGIGLEHSSFNYIDFNNCSGNSNDGIRLNNCDNNTLVNCTIFSNFQSGINLTNSLNNIIYHNNIINNLNQVHIDGNNQWENEDNEGNYWSDYHGVDNGVNDRLLGDGIGDTFIPHLGLDNYPFIQMSGWQYPGTPTLISPGDYDPDGNFSLAWTST